MNELASEGALLGEGLPVSHAIRTGWVRVGSVALGALSLVALLLAGRRSILPVSLLSLAYDALNKFLSVQINVDLSRLRPPPEPPKDLRAAQGLGVPGQGLAGMGSESPFARIAAVIGIALAVALGLLLVYFLIRPLLSRETRGQWKGLHPLAFLRERSAQLHMLVRRALRAIALWLRSPSKGVTTAMRAVVDGLRETISRRRETRSQRPTEAERERRRRLGRVLREFVRLVRWGERTGVPFDKSVGPREFAVL